MRSLFGFWFGGFPLLLPAACVVLVALLAFTCGFCLCRCFNVIFLWVILFGACDCFVAWFGWLLLVLRCWASCCVDLIVFFDYGFDSALRFMWFDYVACILLCLWFDCVCLLFWLLFVVWVYLCICGFFVLIQLFWVGLCLL